MDRYSQESAVSILAFERAGIKTVWQVEIDPYCSEFLQDTFPRQNDLQMCEKSESTISSQLTLSPEDSHARTLVRLVSEPVSTGSAADSGGSFLESFAKYDRTLWSWRTSQRCLIGEWGEFSETWPRSGMTRNGTAYQLAPLAPLTNETGCSLFATPTLRDAKSRGGSTYGRSLAWDLSYPNPAFVEWLMGYPARWVVVEGTRKLQRWLTPSSPKLPSGSEGD